MDFQGRPEEDTVFRKDRMSEFVQLSQMLDGLPTNFRFLGLQILAMMLGTTKRPQVKYTVTHTPQYTKDAKTTTTIRQAIAAEIVILKGEPVSRDEATNEINSANGLLRPAQALILGRIAGKRKFAVENEGIDTL